MFSKDGSMGALNVPFNAKRYNVRYNELVKSTLKARYIF